MEKVIASLSLLAFAAVAYASEPAAPAAQPELRPAQKLMQARKAWRDNMEKNLATQKFDAVAKDADALAAQTQTVGEKHPNPLGKELTLKIAGLAKEVSAAAAKQDGETVKNKIGSIKATCSECHAKIRDKK